MQPAEPARLIERLAQTPAALAELFAGRSEATLRRRPAADAFSPIEHLCHLRDIEREGYAIRIQRILEESMPRLPDLDGEQLARERGYLEQDAARALAGFDRARALVIELLASASAEDWRRTASLGGFGILTLASLAERIIEHDAEHLAALREIEQPR